MKPTLAEKGNHQPQMIMLLVEPTDSIQRQQPHQQPPPNREQDSKQQEVSSKRARNPSMSDNQLCHQTDPDDQRWSSRSESQDDDAHQVRLNGGSRYDDNVIDSSTRGSQDNIEQQVLFISATNSRTSKPKAMRHSIGGLTSLLVILFGLALCATQLIAAGASTTSTNTTTTSRGNFMPMAATTAATITVEEAIKLAAAANSSEAEATFARDQVDPAPSSIGELTSSTSDEPTTATTTTTNGDHPEDADQDGGANEESTSDSTTGDQDDDDDDERSSGGSSDTTETKPGAFIVATANVAADKIVELVRAKGDQNDDDDDGSESSELTGNTAATNQTTNLSQAEAGAKVAKETKKEAAALPLAIGSNNSTKEELELRRQEEELRVAMDTYRMWKSTGDDIIEIFSRKVLPVIMEHGYDLDAVTMTNLLQAFNAIRALKPWALKLLDASAKITPGLLVGTQSDFGDFDECLSIRVDNPSGLNVDDELDQATGLRSSTVVGKYCLADVEFPKPPRVKLAGGHNEELRSDFEPIELRRPLLNFNDTADFKDTIFVETANFFHMLYVDPIRVGFCLTNKIDQNGFASVFNKLVRDFNVRIDFKDRCVTKYDRPIWSSQQVISAYVLLGACSLVLLSTLMDLLHMKLNKLPLPARFDSWKLDLRSSMIKYQPLFTSFSIIRNTKRLFKQQPAAPVHNLQPSSYTNQIESMICSAGLVRSMAQCSTSTATAAAINSSGVSLSSSSSQQLDSASVESSPSIERRRGSLASSAVNLIGGGASDNQHQTSSSSPPFETHANKLSHQVANFEHHVGVGGPLVKEKLGRRENNLQCLHGIRVITMTWMIVNHTYLFGGFFVLWAHRRLIDIAEWPKSLSFQLVLNGWLTVETYFFLSATIIVLNVMPLMRANRFAYLSYIMHRLIRLMPAYIGLVCLNFLWPLISSGPVWLVKGRSFIQTPCENYLWTNFLFINNWIWPENQCMVHTWFLSADFQLYLLAPVIVYLLYRRPVFGHSLNIIVAILASILSGFVIYANKLMPSTLINKLEFDSIKQQLSYSYFATYQHMGPYCLGIFVGYLLHRHPQIKLPKHLTWLLWLLLPPLSFATLLLTYLWNGAYDEPSLINPSPIVSAFYVAIHRTIWSSLLAWIVFACATGRAKLMSSFLANPIFIPLSRLSFSIYLVHLPVIMFRALNLRHTIEWTDSNILWEACGNFVVSLVFGYFLNVFFESPIINLERVLLDGPIRGQPSDARKSKRHHHEETQASFKQNLSESSGTMTESDEPDKTSSSGPSPLSSPEQVNRNANQFAATAAAGNNHWPANNAGFGGYGIHQKPAAAAAAVTTVDDDDFETSRRVDRLSSISANIERQMESLATNRLVAGDGEGAGKQQQVAPPSGMMDDEPTSVVRHHRLRKYSLGNLQMTMLDRNDDLYPVGGVLPHGRFQQHQKHLQHHPDRPYSASIYSPNESHSFRPLQYATLARTNRPSRDDWPLGYGSVQSPSMPDDDDYFPLVGGSGCGGLISSNNQRRSRSHLGGAMSRPSASAATADNNLARQRIAYLSQRSHHGQPRKYSTLLPGSSATIGHRQDINLSDWRHERRLMPASAQQSGGGGGGGDWLQPGALIPRIDSSTLRRQQKLIHPQQEVAAASSIAEESNSLEERE